MRLYKLIIVFIFTAPFLIQAQYMGGNGRGDVSIILTNVPLPVEEATSYLPTKFDLEQNYPNPFNPATMILYSLPTESFVSIKVYNVTGKEISTLVNHLQTAGEYQIIFDGKNLASGVYLLRMTACEFNSTIKMNLLK